MVFASLSVRMRVDVEALNMVEALGAYGRHRTVSILKSRPDGRGYRLIIAPSVSGQAVAYGYMKALVALAQMKNLPVCDECKRHEVMGGFLKHATSEDKALNEWKLVEQCIVEDLTGFLVPQVGIRRTSPVSFSYMLPDVESSNVALDPQFHVRAPMPGQQPRPFQVEAGTAVYTISVSVDVDRIGRGYERVQEMKAGEGKAASSKSKKKGEPTGESEKEAQQEATTVFDLKTLDKDEREKRIQTAFEALGCLFEGLMFGAKKARYLPVYEVVGAIAALSKPMPFMVSPARLSKNRDYIGATIERAEKYVSLLKDISEEIIILYFDGEGVYTPTERPHAEETQSSEGTPVQHAVAQERLRVERARTFSELLGKLKDKAIKLIEAGSEKR